MADDVTEIEQRRAKQQYPKHDAGRRQIEYLNTRCFLSLLLFICFSFSSRVQYAHAQEQKADRFTFVAMGIPLSEAFDNFIQQSGISVAFQIDLVEDKKAFCRALEYGVEEAIRCLLSGTDLDFIRLSSGTYVLIEKAKVDAQWGEITGRVVDRESGEPLINAHVLLADAGIGDVTNGAGRFAFSKLKPGPHRVVVSYLGYQDIADTIQVIPEENARIELGLNVEPLVSSPIVVSGLTSRYTSDVLDADESELAELLQKSAGQDVIRSVNTIIGVRVGEAMANVHVQGGGTGEHQYRLDGAPAFLPIPNGGIVGPFSPFALEKLTVYKAGFVASKGSHLSGVIEAEHRLTSLTSNTFDIQVDPVSVNGRAMGSLGDRNSLGANWMLAVRKALWSIYQPKELNTHFDNWSSSDLMMWNSFIPENARAGPPPAEVTGSVRPGGFEYVKGEMRGEFEESDFKNNFDFYDLHGAMRIHLGPLKSVHGSVYFGGNSLGDDRVVQGPFQRQGADNAIEDLLFNFKNSYSWNNTIAQLKYEHVLGNRTFAEWGGWYSRFDGKQQFSHNNYRGTYKGMPGEGRRPPGEGFRISPDSLNALGLGYDDTNEISEFGLKATINHTFGERNFLTSGIELARDMSDFTLNLQGTRNGVDWEPNKAAISTGQTRLATFFDNKYSINESTSLIVGLRLTYLLSHQQVFAEPRFSFRHDQKAGILGPWAFRAAFGVYRQYINQFDVTSVNRNALIPSMRFWLPVDEAFSPSQSLHFSGAFLLNPHDNWQVRLESYYKWQPHLLVIDYANPTLFGMMATSFNAQDELLHEAEGFAYGAAVSIERKTDVLTTNLQYEFSVAEQRVSNRFDGRSVSVPWNVPHRLSTSFSYRVSDQITILSRLENKIGQAWAFRGVYYNLLEPNPHFEMPASYDLSDPAAHKLPVVSYLDFGISFSKPIKDKLLQVRFDLSNILSYSNVEEWNLTPDSAGNLVKVERPLSPFLPSLVVRLGF